jgi:hypothetical protein
MTAQLDVVGVLLKASKRCLVLNPATGAVSALPEGFAEEHSLHLPDISNYCQLVTVGKVASTGDYKVLRLLCKISLQQTNTMKCCARSSLSMAAAMLGGEERRHLQLMFLSTPFAK